MYIIELFFKIREKIKNCGGIGNACSTLLHEKFFKKNTPVNKPETDEEEKCEHIFSAVDSTNTVLACVKCGFLIHCGSDDFKKKNIFETDLDNTK